MKNKLSTDTIAAIATSEHSGAIAVLRMSGEKSFEIIEKIFSKKNLINFPSHTVHFGEIVFDNEIIDEVLVTIFQQPNSYTGEDVIEISCHASKYIQQKILDCCIKLGARMATQGEFTQRAFLNGKMDLSQAEAVADLIAAESKAAANIALRQMKGKFSNLLYGLREQLIHLTSLVELELDFSEEDVEFADRKKLLDLASNLQKNISNVLSSFAYGNAIKNGIVVAIVGKPNVGKSSWINVLADDEVAIVSATPGTTRDKIETIVHISGLTFRLIDTAGIRESQDEIEQIGVGITFKTIEKSELIVYIFEPEQTNAEDLKNEIENLKTKNSTSPIIIVGNKSDLLKNKNSIIEQYNNFENIIFVSSFSREDKFNLQKNIFDCFEKNYKPQTESVIVTNIRHQQALQKALQATIEVHQGIEAKLSGDLLAVHLREAIYHLGSITGEVDVDKDILGKIFSSFCVGK